jgi:hypothetical protein
MTTQEDITAFLELHSWVVLTNKSAALAYKYYETVVGVKEAQIYLIPEENIWSLTAQYYSKGNNILSTTYVHVNKEEDIDFLFAGLVLFLREIESIISNSYAVKLLRSAK